MNLMVRYINEKWTHGQDTQQWGDVPFPTLADDWSSAEQELFREVDEYTEFNCGKRLSVFARRQRHLHSNRAAIHGAG